jgi:rare lipoprotein A
MQTILHFAALLLLFAMPFEASAQHYERHWNTGVAAPPMRATAITTGALSPPLAPKAPSLTQPRGHALTGLASFYWQDQMTASGERFDKTAMTAAHKTLPLHSRVKVTHVESGRSVIVRINDRGPFKPGRVIDLSDRAAEVLGFKPKGLAQVQLEVLH